jgi:hypothetical protein
MPHILEQIALIKAAGGQITDPGIKPDSDDAHTNTTTDPNV